jgi:plasmid stabilization system protein ParE
MSFKVVNRPAVEADIRAALSYYTQFNPVLATQFIQRLHEATEYLRSAPHSFQVKYGEVRTLLLKQFPYHVHYLVDADREQVVILAVMHAYRLPQDYSRLR